MRRRKSSLRVLISLFVAVVFAIAAEPGVMAMPASQAAQHSMTMDGKAAPCCDHMKPQKDNGTPSKNMSICAGILSCFGMAAIAVEQRAFVPQASSLSLPVLQQTASGRSLQPDNPPPIA